MRWVYTNGYGECDRNRVTDQDVLSCITFDQTGEFISVGDKGNGHIRQQIATRGCANSSLSFQAIFHHLPFPPSKNSAEKVPVNRLGPA